MNSSVNIQIGEAIRSYLESKGLTQQDVADKLGISQGAVSAYYRGKPLGKNAAAKWSKVFGFRINWLLTGEGDMLIGQQKPEVPAEEKPAPEGSLIEYLQRKVAELEREKDDLLQENAVLRYENRRLASDKRESADAVISSLSASAV